MHLAGLAAAAQALPVAAQAAPADYTLEIAPYTLEASPKHRVQTVAYNSQVPGPLLRMREGKPVTLEIRNRSSDPELVHCHGLYLPTAVDGAMEEGTPMIAPGAMVRYTFTPEPAGFRWYHTDTFAGKICARRNTAHSTAS
jgi:FtsP/CotA-like multicopper oxidase with cupredoxin domain